MPAALADAIAVFIGRIWGPCMCVPVLNWRKGALLPGHDTLPQRCLRMLCACSQDNFSSSAEARSVCRLARSLGIRAPVIPGCSSAPHVLSLRPHPCALAAAGETSPALKSLAIFACLCHCVSAPCAGFVAVCCQILVVSANLVGSVTRSQQLVVTEFKRSEEQHV